jgi:hypothetical protein
MDDTPHADTTSTRSGRKSSGKGLLWTFLAVVIAFLVGFFWQWYEASTIRDDLATTRVELEVERLRVRLGQASLAAQSGDFESARRQMSAFFTHLQERGDQLPDEVAALADDFLGMRDEVITGLSRSNPEYAGVLYGMLEQLGTTLDSAWTTPGGMPTGSGEPPAAPATGDTTAPSTGDTTTSPGADTSPAGGASGSDTMP